MIRHSVHTTVNRTATAQRWVFMDTVKQESGHKKRAGKIPAHHSQTNLELIDGIEENRSLNTEDIGTTDNTGFIDVEGAGTG